MGSWTAKRLRRLQTNRSGKLTWFDWHCLAYNRKIIVSAVYGHKKPLAWVRIEHSYLSKMFRMKNHRVQGNHRFWNETLTHGIPLAHRSASLGLDRAIDRPTTSSPFSKQYIPPSSFRRKPSRQTPTNPTRLYCRYCCLNNVSRVVFSTPTRYVPDFVSVLTSCWTIYTT